LVGSASVYVLAVARLVSATTGPSPILMFRAETRRKIRVLRLVRRATTRTCRPILLTCSGRWGLIPSGLSHRCHRSMHAMLRAKMRSHGYAIDGSMYHTDMSMDGSMCHRGMYDRSISVSHDHSTSAPMRACAPKASMGSGRRPIQGASRSSSHAYTAKCQRPGGKCDCTGSRLAWVKSRIILSHK